MWVLLWVGFCLFDWLLGGLRLVGLLFDLFFGFVVLVGFLLFCFGFVGCCDFCFRFCGYCVGGCFDLSLGVVLVVVGWVC